MKKTLVFFWIFLFFVNGCLLNLVYASDDILVKYSKDEISTYNFSARSQYGDGSGATAADGTMTKYTYLGYTSENIDYELFKVVSVFDTNGISTSTNDYYYYYDIYGNLVHYINNNYYVNSDNPSAGAIELPSQFVPGYSWVNDSISLKWEGHIHKGTATYTIIKKETVSVPYGRIEAYQMNISSNLSYTPTMTINGGDPIPTYGRSSLFINSTIWIHPTIAFIKTVENVLYQRYGISKYYLHTSELVSTTISQESPDPPSPDDELDTTIELNFDPIFYLNKYPDLVAAGYNVENVEDHWETTGVYEGRQGSPYFDVNYYLQRYPDLQQIFGNDYYAAYTHWLYNGIAEGRQGSAAFDVHYYLQSYPDLQQAFEGNYQAAFEHWVTCGSIEGRRGTP